MAYTGGGSAGSSYTSTTLVGASVLAATTTEITHATEPWAVVNQAGIVLSPPNAAAANSVFPVSWRCTTAGTVLIRWCNPTAGNLTPSSASGSNPYTFVVLN